MRKKGGGRREIKERRGEGERFCVWQIVDIGSRRSRERERERGDSSLRFPSSFHDLNLAQAPFAVPRQNFPTFLATLPHCLTLCTRCIPHFIYYKYVLYLD